MSSCLQILPHLLARSPAEDLDDLMGMRNYKLQSGNKTPIFGTIAELHTSEGPGSWQANCFSCPSVFKEGCEVAFKLQTTYGGSQWIACTCNQRWQEQRPYD